MRVLDNVDGMYVPTLFFVSLGSAILVLVSRRTDGPGLNAIFLLAGHPAAAYPWLKYLACSHTFR